MRVSAIACGLFACFVSQVAATALTYKLHANEKACFYAKTQKDNEKIAFYFAVRPHPRHHRCSKLTTMRNRSNPVVLSMSTTPSPARATR